MGLEYLQLWADMEALFEPYDDAQRGRLMMAMMAYAYRGEEPNFSGVEKFIWPVLRQHIDRCAANVEAKKAAGSKGGKNKQAEKQTEAEASKGKQTQADASENKQNAHNQYHDHDNDHDHKQEQEKKEENARAREGAPAAAPAEDAVIGIDGTDLSESIRLNAEVDDLLRKYRLSEALHDDLLEDIGKHGLETVKRVMHDASKSDSKGGLSLNFIRSCLASDGKLKAARPLPGGKQERGNMMRHEYSKTDFAKMMVDLDDEPEEPIKRAM